MEKAIINKDWDDIFFKYGEKYKLSNYAFSLYLFTMRLYEELGVNNSKDVLFMSREGQFLKKLFERYCELRKEFGLDVMNIATHYFYGSRNSTMAASLASLEDENFDLLFRFFTFLSSSAFMHSIGFSQEQIVEVGESVKGNIKRYHVNYHKSKYFKELKQCKTFRKIYEENRTSQKEAFTRYMNSFNLDYKKDGLVFVDIGYHGTMQDLINKFFNSEVPIKGYFVKSRSPKEERDFKIGLLSDKSNTRFPGENINSYDAYNYEQILRADHGRCLGYKIVGESAEPVIDTELDDAEVFENYVKKMQAQIFDKFELIARKALQENTDVTTLCIIYYYETIKHKSNYDYNWIIDMQDTSHDDFGIVGYFGRLFSKKLRRIVFKMKDKKFVRQNKRYIQNLINEFKQS